MADAALKPMSLEDFLDWEVRQDERYEFAGGVAFLMAGGTDQHDAVRGNIFASLHRQLAAKPCRARLDLKLVCANERSRYPDVAVDCGPRDPKLTRLGQPVVVVEVLSPSSRSTDYLIKTVDYGSVPSVLVYLIVDPDEPRIDVLRRGVDGRLEPVAHVDDRDAVIDLPEIGCRLVVAEVYGEEAA